MEALLITIVHVFVCLFLIIVVLLQSGESGGSGGGLRGYGFADGLRSSRSGLAALESHDSGGRNFHADLNLAGDRKGA